MLLAVVDWYRPGGADGVSTECRAPDGGAGCALMVSIYPCRRAKGVVVEDAGGGTPTSAGADAGGHISAWLLCSQWWVGQRA
jgi:hypothetical protein